MRDAAIVLLLVSVGILGYFVHSMNAILTDQQRQISNLATKAKASTLDLQEKCAKQAASLFKEGDAQKKAAPVENHYNQRLDRCFAMVYDESIVSGTVILIQDLYDAFGGTNLGTFVRSTGKNGQSTRCFFTMLSGEEKKCSTEEEFKELVKIYMQ
jgi:hypothetical protein